MGELCDRCMVDRLLLEEHLGIEVADARSQPRFTAKEISRRWIEHLRDPSGGTKRSCCLGNRRCY